MHGSLSLVLLACILGVSLQRCKHLLDTGYRSIVCMDVCIVIVVSASVFPDERSDVLRGVSPVSSPRLG